MDGRNFFSMAVCHLKQQASSTSISLLWLPYTHSNANVWQDEFILAVHRTSSMFCKRFVPMSIPIAMIFFDTCHSIRMALATNLEGDVLRAPPTSRDLAVPYFSVLVNCTVQSKNVVCHSARKLCEKLHPEIGWNVHYSWKYIGVMVDIQNHD